MSLNDEETPKCLFRSRYNAGTYKPIKGPVIYQGQNEENTSMILAGREQFHYVMAFSSKKFPPGRPSDFSRWHGNFSSARVAYKLRFVPLFFLKPPTITEAL